MGSLSDYSENKLLDLALSGAAFARAANVFASLHTATLTDTGGGAEVSGNNYARKSILNDSTNFPAAAALAKALAVQKDFATASGSWGTVTDQGLWDASSAGNLLVGDTIATPQTIGANQTPFIAAATGLTISLSGDITTYLGNLLLDHLLGGPDFTPAATLYFALFVAGVEVTGNGYARRAVTNDATNFPAAVGGVKSNGTVIDFVMPTGPWGTVDAFRVFDASSGGNTWFSKALITPRSPDVNKPARFS